MIFMNVRGGLFNAVATIGPMSLRLKINLIVGVLTLVFVAVLTTLQFRSLRESIHEEVASANRVALQMLNRTVWRYAAQGPQAMLSFLEGMGRVRSNDITLIDEAGTELYRSPPSPYKAGREAPDWFDALLAPAPSINSIKFPGGRLEVKANASRAVLDAWDGAVLLGSVAAVLLLAVNALVFWLVGRTVRPFGQIVEALGQLQAGRFDVALPALRGTEAAAMGTAFNRMVGVLQQNIETERRAGRAERELSDSRELTRWMDHHIEQERRMIARELHDELGQSVTAMRSMALSIAQRVAALDPQAETAARLIADESSRLYDAMHGIIPRLTPLVLDNFGLCEALNDLAERTRRSHTELTLTLQADLAHARLPADVALALYRAAQEGITNALRHGQARQLWLTVQGQAAGVRLTLTDDGRGLPPDWAERTGHYGLRWLTERVETLGGSLRLATAEPRGVRLDVHIPLAAQAEPAAEAEAAAAARAGAAA